MGTTPCPERCAAADSHCWVRQETRAALFWRERVQRRTLAAWHGAAAQAHSKPHTLEHAERMFGRSLQAPAAQRGQAWGTDPAGSPNLEAAGLVAPPPEPEVDRMAGTCPYPDPDGSCLDLLAAVHAAPPQQRTDECVAPRTLSLGAPNPSLPSHPRCERAALAASAIGWTAGARGAPETLAIGAITKPMQAPTVPAQRVLPPPRVPAFLQCERLATCASERWWGAVRATQRPEGALGNSGPTMRCPSAPRCGHAALVMGNPFALREHSGEHSGGNPFGRHEGSSCSIEHERCRGSEVEGVSASGQLGAEVAAMEAALREFQALRGAAAASAERAGRLRAAAASARPPSAFYPQPSGLGHASGAAGEICRPGVLGCMKRATVDQLGPKLLRQRPGLCFLCARLYPHAIRIWLGASDY